MLEKILEEARTEEKVDKIKVSSAEIVVHGTKEKPYYEIKHREVGNSSYHVGYSSYDLNNVFGWLEECFELVDADNNEWIPCDVRLPKVPDGTDDIDCPEFNVTIKVADVATTLKHDPDGTWFDDDGYVYEVIVWQPLPKPYRPEKGAEE